MTVFLTFSSSLLEVNVQVLLRTLSDVFNFPRCINNVSLLTIAAVIRYSRKVGSCGVKLHAFFLPEASKAFLTCYLWPVLYTTMKTSFFMPKIQIIFCLLWIKLRCAHKNKPKGGGGRQPDLVPSAQTLWLPAFTPRMGHCWLWIHTVCPAQDLRKCSNSRCAGPALAAHTHLLLLSASLTDITRLKFRVKCIFRVLL